MNKCKFCKYYQNGICRMPIWADGKFYAGQQAEPEKSCDLFEALVTMEEEER